ncbi:hypothetical protein Hanom_Chr05g00425271 [Helianthus anomalus]
MSKVSPSRGNLLYKRHLTSFTWDIPDQPRSSWISDLSSCLSRTCFLHVSLLHLKSYNLLDIASETEPPSAEDLK